jgi:hypothetical protein
MFRLFGFLIGSAASVAAILLVTGVPKFHLEDPVIDQQRFDEAVDKLMARKLEAELAIQEQVDEPVQAAETVQEPVIMPDIAAEDTQVTEDLELQSVTETFEGVAEAENEFDFGEPDPNLAPLTEMRWYSFWNPFRSELAASGFVSRLEKVTGLDYRVVKVKTGVYEVAFAYGDDVERHAKLSQISAATGLDLPDS